MSIPAQQTYMEDISVEVNILILRRSCVALLKKNMYSRSAENCSSVSCIMSVHSLSSFCYPDAARKYGIRSAMPGFIGRRLCPELVFVKPNFQKYTRAAAATRAIFAQYDPDFEAGSLDEAYLDVTDYCRSHETTGRESIALHTPLHACACS